MENEECPYYLLPLLKLKWPTRSKSVMYTNHMLDFPLTPISKLYSAFVSRLTVMTIISAAPTI